MNLDENQTKLVNLKEGRYIIYAGAGSGKTATIEHRVKQLIEDGINPSSILCITFTSAAAQEMSIRIANPEVHCSTIHSLMLKILKAEGRKLFPELYPVKVLSPAKQHILFTKCLANIFDTDIEARSVKMMIEKAANKMLLSTGDEEVDDVWQLYKEAKLKDGSIDFTDMLTMGLECLKANQLKYQKKFEWLLLDEGQDTSKIQHEAIRLIANSNIFILCSVEQSLYGWRTASPELMLNIEETYPDIQKFYLDRNYRSGDRIISIANNLIADSKYKTLLMTGLGKSSTTEYLGHFSNINEEIDTICNMIKPDEDTMILYRTNWYSMSVELGLKLYGLKYEFISGTSFFDFSEVQDMICFCRLAKNQEDIEAFDRIFNKPNRYLGHKWKASFDIEYSRVNSIRQALDTNYQDANSRERAYWKKSQVELLGILGILEHLERPDDIINIVRRQLKYNQYWLKQCQSDDEDESALARLDELESAASQYADLDLFLESAKGSYSGGILGNGDRECNVRLGTGHASKGLEADTVFIIGLMQGLLPHYRSTDIEEERRILYVMLTRGRSKVYMSSCWHRQWEKPSNFLYQLRGDVIIND